MIVIKITAKDLSYINRFASKVPTHYNLNGVFLATNRDLVATDGHRLGCLPRGWDYDVTVKSDEICDGGIILNTTEKTVAAVIKKMQGTVTVEVESPDSTVALIRDDAGLQVQVRIIDGSYPPYERVRPIEERKEATTAIAFDPKYINDFAGYEKDDRIQFVPYGNEAPCVIHNSKQPRFWGLLMPVHLDVEFEKDE